MSEASETQKETKTEFFAIDRGMWAKTSALGHELWVRLVFDLLDEIGDAHEITASPNMHLAPRENGLISGSMLPE